MKKMWEMKYGGRFGRRGRRQKKLREFIKMNASPYDFAYEIKSVV
jgi:hypothetical protein